MENILAGKGLGTLDELRMKDSFKGTNWRGALAKLSGLEKPTWEKYLISIYAFGGLNWICGCCVLEDQVDKSPRTDNFQWSLSGLRLPSSSVNEDFRLALQEGDCVTLNICLPHNRLRPSKRPQQEILPGPKVLVEISKVFSTFKPYVSPRSLRD